jgi:hypothetical protein
MNHQGITKLMIAGTVSATLGLSCSSKSEGEEGVDVEKAPYQAWDANTATVFTGATKTDDTAVMKLEKLPDTERVVNGKTLATYVAAMPETAATPIDASSPNSATVEAGVDEDGTITITSFSGNGIVGAATGLDLGTLAGETITLSDPLSINMDEMATGETRTAVINTTIAGLDIPVSVTYGPEEEDVSLDIARGHIVGCRRFHVSGQFESTGLPLSGELIEGDGYYHPTLGLVGWSVPSLGIGLTMSASSNYGTATEGWNVIQKTQVLTATVGSFSLSTYDRAGQYDADKNTHAKMLLELRWADEANATTLDAPHELMAPVTFGTFGGMFYFAHEMVETSASVFFPEENGNGFRYWYGFVSQGAKNQEANGISYDIIVDKDSSLPDLRVTGRIGYNILPAGSYALTN